MLVCLCGLATVTVIGARTEEALTQRADRLFEAGKFAEAQEAYAQLHREDPKDFHAILRLGALALFSNRLGEAEKFLQQALDLNPKDNVARRYLAEVYYRQDDFDRAAPILRELGQEAPAAKLASFHGQRAYDMQIPSDGVRVPFVVTDPLPVVHARINGGEEVNFVIDTGAPEVQVDAEIARQTGLKEFGSTTGTFAGGRKAQVRHGRLDSLGLGGLVVKNIPVGIMDLSGLGKAMFGGRRIAGVIGTVLFYHFRTTLDYPGKQLIFRPRGGPASKSAPDEKAVPFWMAGDHFVVAWGRVNDGAPVLLFVDTGLAGGGLDASESLIREAHITLDEAHASQGLGGGGMVRVVPFVVKELSLGDIRRRNVQGLFSGPLPAEHSQGFHISGVISHGFFKPFALTFDFDQMKLFIRRPH
jgi:predicted aspartyl protease